MPQFNNRPLRTDNIALFLDIENFAPQYKTEIIRRIEDLLLSVFNMAYPEKTIEDLGLLWGDACKGAKGSLHAKMNNGVVFPTMTELKAFVHHKFVPAILAEEEPVNPLNNVWFHHRAFRIQRNADREPRAFFVNEQPGEQEKKFRRTTKQQFVWYMIKTENGFLPPVDR